MCSTPYWYLFGCELNAQKDRIEYIRDVVFGFNYKESVIEYDLLEKALEQIGRLRRNALHTSPDWDELTVILKSVQYDIDKVSTNHQTMITLLRS
jgi:hypothetical protein